MENLLTVIVPVYNQESLITRALDSIPARPDIEVIVIDDGSIDDTWTVLQAYRESNRLPNLILLYNKENKGVSYTVNRGYNNATGKYIVNLGSDDYFYTDQLLEVLPILTECNFDLVYFNLRVNNGDILRLIPENRTSLCGSVKFMRREFLGESRCPEDKRSGEDWHLMQQLVAKNPQECYTDKVVKHYNFPREGSLYDQMVKGQI